MILGWINTVQVSVAFAFSFGMHAPFMFEYRWKRILQTLNIILMAWNHSLSSIRHCDIIHDANTTKMPV